MPFRFHFLVHSLIAFLLAIATTAVLHGQAATPTPATAAVHGHIADPSGALIPGAQIAVATQAGVTVGSAKADAGGAYEIRGLAPGTYIVSVTFAGFAPFQSQPLVLTAGQVKRVDVAMAIEAAQQNVVVTDESPTVSVEAGANANSVVIKGKDLDAFSDDPDELSNELQALAGPSAGPNGGQIYIDGFTGGQLPPKSAIREIRINQNPFSAEFDRLGYGRIEILTKPGTDKMHGQFFAMGNDKSFNTGNPFVSNMPSYDSYMFNGSVSGALSKSASFFVSAQQRNTADDYVYTAVLSQDDPLIQQTGGVYSPHVRTNIAPRIDLQLGARNTLTLRYQLWRDSASGVLGSTTSLPAQATGSTSYEHTVQASDSVIINDHVVNETRFQYIRDIAHDTSVSTAPQVTVPNYFTGGGASSQFASDHEDHYELWNLTTMGLGAHALKFGMRLRDQRTASSTNANFNGTFMFANTATYQRLLSDLANGKTFTEIAADCAASSTPCDLPAQLTYTTGPLPATANVFDAALFLQDDWKVNRLLTVSGGLRWESQNHIADHNDWAPRVAFAYALDGHAKSAQTKTVWRGGYGFFYDRFSADSLLSAARQSGGANSQRQVTIANPTCFDATSLSNIDLSTCGTATSGASTIVQIAPNYHSPYTQQIATSIERQLTKTTTVTATYLRSFGVHQLVTRNANQCYDWDFSTATCPDPITSYPTGSAGIINQFYPEAVFKQNQVIVNINARIKPTFGIFGFYNWTQAKSNGNGSASNAYNLNQDYGRASFASTNMLFLMANYTAPWAIRLNPFLVAQSGKPYNIVTNNDLTGSNYFNNRPAIADSSLCSAQSNRYAQTQFGCLDTMPTGNYTPIAANMGNGPAAVALNLRLSRSFGIGPKIAGNGQDGQHGGPSPGGGHGGRGGGPGGGLGPGGLSGGGGPPRGMFGGGTNRKYSLTFSAQAMNLFNNVDYGTPFGSIMPTWDAATGTTNAGDRFGHSYSLAHGMFASPTSSAVRRIFFQAEFSF